MQIQCRTIFDISETGITGHYKPQQVPFRDRAGNNIVDQAAWTRSRNQQRNLETITQLLQLRTQIFDVSTPETNQGYWSFWFDVEFEGIYQQGQDVFGILKKDCEGVPMLLGLDEKFVTNSFLTAEGSQQNIWFEISSVNNLS
jgi:hypothetical protein